MGGKMYPKDKKCLWLPNLIWVDRRKYLWQLVDRHQEKMSFCGNWPPATREHPAPFQRKGRIYLLVKYADSWPVLEERGLLAFSLSPLFLIGGKATVRWILVSWVVNVDWKHLLRSKVQLKGKYASGLQWVLCCYFMNGKHPYTTPGLRTNKCA